MLEQPQRPPIDKRAYYSALGTTKHVREWARELNLSLAQLYRRIQQLGKPGSLWTWERAFSEKSRTRSEITYKGETLSVTAWAKKLGMKPKTLRQRLGRGVSFKKIVKEVEGAHTVKGLLPEFENAI